MIDWRTSDLRDIGLELSLETQSSIESYLLRGWAPGGYVESMLAHDYARAFACADTANRESHPFPTLPDFPSSTDIVAKAEELKKFVDAA